MTYKLLAEIEKNIKDEADAREGYYKLMEILPEEDLSIIEEIISDELNHSEKLRKLAFKYSGIEESIS